MGFLELIPKLSLTPDFGRKTRYTSTSAAFVFFLLYCIPPWKQTLCHSLVSVVSLVSKSNQLSTGYFEQYLSNHHFKVQTPHSATYYQYPRPSLRLDEFAEVTSRRQQRIGDPIRPTHLYSLDSCSSPTRCPQTTPPQQKPSPSQYRHPPHQVQKPPAPPGLAAYPRHVEETTTPLTPKDPPPQTTRPKSYNQPTKRNANSSKPSNRCHPSNEFSP